MTMADGPRDKAWLKLETLIRETAGGARRTRRLAERVLLELTAVTPASVAPAFRPCPPPQAGPAHRRFEEETGEETDAEPAWRRAA
jgi:hypothetical protein